MKFFKLKKKVFQYSKPLYFSIRVKGVQSEAISRKLEAKTETSEKASLKGEIKDFVNDVNKEFIDFNSRLNDLPDKFVKDARNSLVNYFLQSADRFDKDSEKGLDMVEFSNYRKSMLRRTRLLLSQYAPNKYLIEAREKQKKQKEKIDEFTKKLDRMATEGGDKFDDNNLSNPKRAQEELTKVHSQSRAIHKKAEVISKPLNKVLKLIRAYKKIGQKAFFGAVRQKIGAGKDMQKDLYRLNAALQTVMKKHHKKLDEKRQRVAEHGVKISRATNAMKEQVLRRRDKELRETIGKKDKRALRKKKNAKLYEQLKKRKEELLRHKKLKIDASGVVEGAISHVGHPSIKNLKENKKNFSTALQKIDGLLENPNLSEEARAKLTEKREKIQSGCDATEIAINDTDASWARKSNVAIDKYITETIDPTMGALNDSIHTIDVEMRKNGNPLEQITAKYSDTVESIDKLSKDVNDNLITLNTTNSFLLHNIETSVKNLNRNVIEIGIKNTFTSLSSTMISSTLETAGRGIKYVASDLVGKKVLGGLADLARKVPYLGEYAVGPGLDIANGVVQILGETVGGILQMAAYPIKTVKGIYKMLTDKKAFLDMMEALAAYKDFKKGEYAIASGKILGEFLMTLTGYSMASSGVRAARLAYFASRISKKSGRFGALKAAVVEFARGAGQGAKHSIYLTVENLSKLKYLAKNLGKAVTYKNAAIMLSDVVENVAEASKRFKDSLVNAKKNKVLGRTIAKKIATPVIYIGNRIKDRFTAEGLAKKYEKLQAKKLAKAEEYAQFDSMVKQTMAKNPDFNKSEAIAHVLKDKNYRQVAIEGIEYLRIQNTLDKIEQKIDVKLYGKKNQQYQEGLREVATHFDEIGSINKLAKKYKLEPPKNSKQRIEVLEKLIKVEKGETLVKLKKLLERERKKIKAPDGKTITIGERTDAAIKLKKEIKKMRGGDYIYDKSMLTALEEAGVQGAKALKAHIEKYGKSPSGFQARIRKGLVERIKRDPDYVKIQNKLVHKKVGELCEKIGVDPKTEMARMSDSLYKNRGIEKWDMDELLKNTEGLSRRERYDKIQESLTKHLDKFKDGPNALAIDDIQNIKGQLAEMMKIAQGADPPISNANLMKLLDDSANKMLYQTVETSFRQLGDHGIRHIRGNINTSLEYIETMSKQTGMHFSARDKLQMMVTHINHDLGYTSGIAAKGFSGTTVHPQVSTYLFINNEKMMSVYKNIFGGKGTNRIVNMITNHDGIENYGIKRAKDILKCENLDELDKLRRAGKINEITYRERKRDYMLNQSRLFYNATKLGDNMGLYSGEKLPQLFYRDTQLEVLLVQIANVAKNKKVIETRIKPMLENLKEKRKSGQITEAQYKKESGAYLEILNASDRIDYLKDVMKSRLLQLHSKKRISSAELRMFVNAVDELAAKSPEFSLGMLAGKHGDTKFTARYDPETGSFYTQINLQGNKLFDEIQKNLKVLTKEKYADSFAVMEADLNFDLSTKQFKKLIEDYADGNGAVIIYKGKQISRIEDGEVKINTAELKKAIKEEGLIELKTPGGRRIIDINFSRTANHKKHIQRFEDSLTGKSNEEKLNIVNRKKRDIESQLNELDSKISATGKPERLSELLDKRNALREDLDYITNHETINIIAVKEKPRLRAIGALEELKASLQGGVRTSPDHIFSYLEGANTPEGFIDDVARIISSTDEIPARLKELDKLTSQIYSEIKSEYKLETKSSHNAHQILQGISDASKSEWATQTQRPWINI